MIVEVVVNPQERRNKSHEPQPTQTKTTIFDNLKVFIYLCIVKQRQRKNYY